MKIVLYILIFTFISCNENVEIKEIEILSYYSNPQNFAIYSSIDKEGFAQTLSKSEVKDFTDFYQSRIRKSLIDSILNLCRYNKTENLYKFKRSENIWYHGYRHAVRVTYENDDQIYFQYAYTNEENKQFRPFQILSNHVHLDSLNASRLNLGQVGQIYLKQETLSRYSKGQDSIWTVEYLKKK